MPPGTGESGAGDGPFGGPTADGTAADGTAAEGTAAEGTAAAASLVESDIEGLIEEISDEILDPVAVVAAERDEYLDALRRLQADFDNYRKRAHREAAEAGDRALGGFVEGLLPVLDAVDAARTHGVAEVDQIAGLLLDVLAKQGLQRLGAAGDVFNPEHHDAVAHEDGDDSGVQTIAELYRAGWTWKGRVLRPAMVKVVG